MYQNVSECIRMYQSVSKGIKMYQKALPQCFQVALAAVDTVHVG